MGVFYLWVNHLFQRLSSENESVLVESSLQPQVCGLAATHELVMLVTKGVSFRCCVRQAGA